MPEPMPVEALHAEYALLILQPPDTLATGQLRSLSYYVAELAHVDSSARGEGARDEVAVWVHRLVTLDAFVGREGRMPRENRRLPRGAISLEEKELVGYVRSDRRLFATGKLCSYQQRRLLCIPGFTFRPLDDLWRGNLEGYDRFTTNHRHAPRLRSDDAEECSLARWAAKARMRYWAGTLPQQRIDDLTDSLAFWTWGMPSKRGTYTVRRASERPDR